MKEKKKYLLYADGYKREKQNDKKKDRDIEDGRCLTTTPTIRERFTTKTKKGR